MKKITMFTLVMIFCMAAACTKKSDVQSVSVEYKADNISMKGYLASDNKIKGKRPGILLIHEWWGQDEPIRKRAKMLASLGYTVLAVDMFGDGKQAKDAEEAAKFAKEISEDMEVKKARFNAAMNLLKQQDTVDPEHIAAIGYSFGGYIALEMARQGTDLDGIVTFYGGLTTKDPAQPNAVKAKILICQGDKDWYVPPHYVTEFTQEMKHAGADFRIITYEEAEHGFANPEAASYKDTFKMHYEYNEKADKKSWEDAQAFLKDIFRK
ncbi:MAG: dienelactone hydrolase family protein [Nitrospiraceae bacterium]|nr:MAG: dienelactone hydrolase family protein [Nitrospiraceae bacterium]